MIIILFLCFCLVTSNHSQRVDGIQSTLEEDFELERQLKVINKPPVKSINTKFGHIVDCIDINKQPAFDHPLLKDHKLQRKPSFWQTKTTAKANVKNSAAIPIIGLEKDLCPTGTVPIRRTTKDDLIGAKSLFNTHILTPGQAGTHVAEVTLIKLDLEPYYGVGGIGSVYSPKVENYQTTSGHIWVRNGPIDGTNKIMVGWHVAPVLHGGDDSTYLFAVWTSDNFKKTGCFNVLCRGFVQTDNRGYLGAKVANTSVYGGIMYELTASIKQDPKTKNWWILVQNNTIGYFPAALFSNLSSADQVGWGGRTTTTPGSPSPPMGSGYFPDDNFVHACYFKHVTYQNGSRRDFGPFYITDTFSDNKNCFGVEYYGDQGGSVGYSLQYGGPGGNCGN